MADLSSIVTAAVRMDERGEAWVRLPTSSAVVQSTSSFAPWEQRRDDSLLELHEAIHLFLSRCSLSKEIDRRLPKLVNPLVFNLNEKGWSRVLSVLVHAGLFSHSYEEVHTFLQKLEELELDDDALAALLLGPDDLALGESFDSPSSSSQGRGRERSQAQSSGEGMVAGPPALRYLSLVPVTVLTSDRGAPLGPLCRLISLLGPCYSRASRLDELAPVNISAAILTQGLHAFLGASHPTLGHPVLAAYLNDFLIATELPWLWRGAAPNAAARRMELSDGIR